MSGRIRKNVVILVSLGALLVIAFIVRSGFLPFIATQANSIQNAGTWEDDSKNWYRAFNEEQPAQIKVVHSKYWKSNHFTHEFIYYFEVAVTPEWKDKFLAEHGLKQVSPGMARSFRSNISSDDTPNWFAPDPVDRYDVWDKAGYFGSVWIDKANGHIFFYDMML
jgi:hypothetical protein